MYSVIYQELKSQKETFSSSVELENIHRKLTNPSKILSRAVGVIVLDYCSENKLDYSRFILDNGKSAYILLSSIPSELKILLYRLSLHIK